MNLLEVDNIELKFKSKDILKAIYFKAKKGKVTGILGSNGTGKSSLIKIIFGNLIPNNKLIRIDKKPILKPLYQKGIVKMLPQTNIFPESFSLKKGFELYKVSLEVFFNEFTEFIDFKNYHFSMFSGGERRLIETYIILKSNANIILLDEPFSHISPIFIKKIKDIINSEREKKIIIITDHLYKDILDISDDIYLLKDGWSKLIKKHDELIFYNYTNTL